MSLYPCHRFIWCKNVQTHFVSVGGDIVNSFANKLLTAENSTNSTNCLFTFTQPLNTYTTEIWTFQDISFGGFCLTLTTLARRIGEALDFFCVRNIM